VATADEMLSQFPECAVIGEVSGRVNEFLSTAVAVVRERFDGKIT
jgi:hypothetical protein